MCTYTYMLELQPPGLAPYTPPKTEKPNARTRADKYVQSYENHAPTQRWTFILHTFLSNIHGRAKNDYCSQNPRRRYRRPRCVCMCVCVGGGGSRHAAQTKRSTYSGPSRRGTVERPGKSDTSRAKRVVPRTRTHAHSSGCRQPSRLR